MTASPPALHLAAGSGGLEWAEVLGLLAREARTPMGRERALDTRPVTDLAAIRQRLGETAQARAALGQEGAPPWEGIPDVRPMLEAARVPGSVAEGADLAALLPLIEAAARLRAYGRAIAPVAPDLAAALAGVPHQKALADLLGRSLDPDGQVRDEASPALRRLRQRVRELRRDIVKRLEGYFNGPNADTTFQERYVTVRHGRYVLPIRVEAKGRLRGIVHDRSQSGATLFVEPEAMVEANNDLVQATREEEAEVVRILAALTDAVREALPELDALVAGIAGLDLIFARGALAERMEAVEPTVGEERDVVLRGARNPLLLAQRWRAAEGAPADAVIPMDIEIGADRPLLVITGPNAGGKTVALKTLGLSALMAQAGLFVPAAEGSRLPFFTAVLADIGDEQSIERDLSTFSGHAENLASI
ncbi:MAG TPA: endonuclease MutS2, partial [Methylomirabilota bacterium]|nr:endonuclease MutS2 [Methylomirabilota bacterium]